ncbi:type II asparaginase [Amantichitinum ursilacus]|uniref:Glutaminase-asparaginase n=1 Tax=Amantichitinum ursilacus TaxID=857265 RepID=A0A0N0GR24_9NEIS|nr:type II asparaginase [Amantichitinum ursilacus]KPC55281.1 Glutaminase-asparaginase precursor [Amantichitinum ursilacus]
MLSRLFQRSLFVAVTCSAVFAQAADKLPNVVILATGGTIAGTGATSTTTVGYTAAKVGVDRLIEAVPELKQIANVSGEQTFQIASENMTNENWLTLAKRVNVLLKQSNVDGIVITHGTDTIEETAYFLNLTVKSRKPVVIVGSMRPSTAISADGPINLYNAVAVAGSADSVNRGVLVAMNDEILGARDVTKTNTMLANTFRSPELGDLGYIVSGKPKFYRATTRKHTADTEFDISKLDKLPAVDIAYGSANANTIAIDAFAAAGDEGIVYAGTGDGSLSTPVRARLTELRQKGFFILRSSRVGNGPTVRGGENDDDKTDFVVSDTLSPQKARILLMLALTRTHDTKKIQDMFYTY